ncbi:MAG: hypothetical protein M1819_006235 [Sarea resinae]|nr:MAG: hypothetical protein M1819_006235 [Sarea resinae]
MENATTFSDLPPLPSYTLQPLPSLVPPIPDKVLSLLLPVVAYWALSMTFHLVDTYDLFPQYRLHTPAEVLKRNHATRLEVVRDVLLQHVIQTIFGLLMLVVEPEDVFGKEDYDVAVWAQRIRLAQRAIPAVLSAVGLDALGLAKKVSSPALAGALAGGSYPWLTQTMTVAAGKDAVVPVFASWEIFAAKAIYWFLVPALQFLFGILIVDTWQYFLHRLMHMNRWLYATFHSRHHRLYVPYAYGALYNHPFEGFLLDTLGTGIAYMLSGMSTRQGMWFFTCSTIKTVDDHCGYALPFDPLQHITSNNAGYHDIHHQSWGIKTNFSQPFFTFWDSSLGTQWVGGDVSARYAKSRLHAQQKLDYEKQHPEEPPHFTHIRTHESESSSEDDRPYHDEIANAKHSPEALLNIPPKVSAGGKAAQQAVGSREQVLDDKVGGGPAVLIAEAEEERDAKAALKRSTRQKAGTSTAPADSLKNLR